MGSIRDIQGWALTNWFHPPMYTYIVLPDGYDPQKIEARLPAFVTRNMPERAASERRMHLQPITDIHLHSKLESEMGVTGDIAYVYIFTTIVFFVLLIACINFMNLATARSALRAREVGLRQVVGARRWQLMSQFYSESLLFVGLALSIAIVLVKYFLPAFNDLVDKELSLSYLGNWQVMLSFVAFAIATGLIAGSYPAMLLSRLQPASILQSNAPSAAGNKGSAYLRSFLVLMQFAISICLIIASNVIKDQLIFIKNKNSDLRRSRFLSFRYATATCKLTGNLPRLGCLVILRFSL